MTTLVLNQIPRFPAHVSATNGFKAVIENGVDVVIQPSYGDLVPVPAVTKPSATYFMAWDKDIDYYQSISFQDFADNLAETVLEGSILAIKNVTFAPNQGIYFIDANTAAAYDLSAFVRGISGSADAQTFRTAIELGSNALKTLNGLTLVAGDILYAGSSNALLRLPAGSTGQVLTISGGNPTWSPLDLGTSIHALTAKAAIDDADEFGLADSTATFSSKRATLGNFVSSIFKTARTIANAQFASATFKLFNAAGTPRALMFNTTALTADRTITVPDANIDLGRTGIKPQAAVTPSGAAFTLSGIPAAVQRVSLKFAGLLISAAAQPIIRLGSAGGVVSSGYVVGAGGLAGSGSSTSRSATFIPVNSSSLSYSNSNPIWGDLILTRSALGSNKWVITGGFTRDTNGIDTIQGGIDLGAELTQIQITTVAGTATFIGSDTVAIEWEF